MAPCSPPANGETGLQSDGQRFSHEGSLDGCHRASSLRPFSRGCPRLGSDAIEHVAFRYDPNNLIAIDPDRADALSPNSDT